MNITIAMDDDIGKVVIVLLYVLIATELLNTVSRIIVHVLERKFKKGTV